jgi:glucosamine--fructose-6-phosphate aminotransferase (isomerizing)
MNLNEEKYSKYALVREMMETPEVVKSFDPKSVKPFAQAAALMKGLFLTGEGSSRILPAKRAIYAALKGEFKLPLMTEGCTQAIEYNLKDFAVFAASNSGQTREVIRLVMELKKQNHKNVFGLTANQNTRLEEFAVKTYFLNCGKENAVAATKSVIEQTLFYDALIRLLKGEKMQGLTELAEKIYTALTLKIDPEIIKIIREADIVYFAGRNNGVAEELALKTNETTRKKSDFLEGTFAVHGIEEVMNKNEVLIWIDPFAEEQNKFSECLIKGVGMNIIAVSSKQTQFPTIIIPDDDRYSEYIQLAAGWNILVETGVSLGINLDKPQRARKIGNEYIEG